MTNQNLLSIIINGRNDNYNPYFISRLNFVIEHTFYIAKNLKLQNEIQFDICDWGSLNKIRKNLKLSNENIKKVNFYEIPKEVADLESQKKNRYFNFAKSNNVALRRSSGKFLLIPSHDLIFNQSGLLNLFNILNNSHETLIDTDNFFLNIERVFLPKKLFNTTPSFEYLERWISHSSLSAIDKHVLNGGAQGGYLTSKKNWFKLTGIHEGYDGYGFHEFDLFSRANLDLNWFDSSNFGICLYKLYRGFSPIRSNAKQNLNTQWTSFYQNINSDNWGLANLNLEKMNITNGEKIDEKSLTLMKLENVNSKIGFFEFKKYIINSTNINTNFKKVFIKLDEIKTIFLFKRILDKFKETKAISFIGYNNPLIPVSISNINTTLELFILDDMKGYLELFYQNKNLNFSKFNDFTGLLYNRLILVSECMMKKKDRHVGYFKPISGDVINDLELNLTHLPEQKGACILFINLSVVNKQRYEKLIQNINNFSDKDKISLIIFKKDFYNKNKEFKLQNFFILYDDKSNIIYKQKNTNISFKPNIKLLKLLVLFVLINFDLLNINLKKLFKFLYRKLLG